MKRREFIKQAVIAGMAANIPGGLSRLHGQTGNLVVQVTGESPYEITKKAVEALGGMAKFISKGDVVMVKPNLGWNRTVEQAADTNPEVIRAVIEMILNAGAKKVVVMDNPCHKAEDTYSRSGVQAVAKKLGADVRYPNEDRLVIHDFKGERVGRWPVFKDFLEIDKFINVPILKHHGSSALTIAMKNLYGILGGNRGKLHRDIGGGIADIAAGFKTHLNIVDAYRVLMRNGPVGGRVSDVEFKKTVIASSGIMEADVSAAVLFGIEPAQVPSIQAAFEKKMGAMDMTKINLKKIRV